MYSDHIPEKDYRNLALTKQKSWNSNSASRHHKRTPLLPFLMTLGMSKTCLSVCV